MTLGKFLFTVFCLLGLGGAAYALVANNMEPAPVETTEEDIVEAPVLTPERPELEEEYQSTKPPIVTPTTKEETTETLPSTATPTPVIHHPNAVLQEEDRYRITTAWEYVANYAGVCPSAQTDETGYKKDWMYRAAVGLWSDYPTPEHFVETYWNQYMKGQNFATEEVMATFPMLGLAGADDIGFYVNWDTFDVYYDSVWPERRPRRVTASEQAQAEEMAGRMKAYLRQVDDLYNSRCPNN